MRLEGAGWANVGKTNLHEFAYGVTSQNPHFGDVPNPAAPGRVAGGSSGGSAAALAAGLCEGALGTDSGGSIRIPAACCGIVGFKPSHGLVPLDGCYPLAPSFDHAGPLATNVSVCTELMRALAPCREWDPPIGSLAEVEVGVAWIDSADALVAARVRKAAEALPRRRSVDVPLTHGSGAAFMREAAETHRELWAEHRNAYGPNLAAKLERCFAVTDDEYASARRARDRYRDAMGSVFDQVDLLLTPTLAFVAPPAAVDELGIREAMIRFTYPFNAIGAPALALPCGAAELGLPASLQLVGPVGADALVLAAGELLERELGAVR